jgi:hypothetical protein
LQNQGLALARPNVNSVCETGGAANKGLVQATACLHRRGDERCAASRA